MKAYRLNEHDVYAGNDLMDAILACMADQCASMEDVFDDLYGQEVDPSTVFTLDEEGDPRVTVAEYLATMQGPGSVFSYGE